MNVNCDDCSANGISAHWQGSPEAIPIWKVLILCARRGGGGGAAWSDGVGCGLCCACRARFIDRLQHRLVELVHDVQGGGGGVGD